jgi:two-component system phosphate regulon sensor histidine kinase PhoR
MTINKVDRIADIIGEDLSLRATIINDKGIVLGDSDLTAEQVEKMENHFYRPEVQRAQRNGVGLSRRYSSTIRTDLLYVAVLYDKSGSKGFMRLALPLSEIETVQNNIRNIILMLFGFAFIVFWLIGYFASVAVSRPIKEISFSARSIAAGNFNNKIVVNSKDEIFDLAEAFNFMSLQIKSRIQEVIASKSRLEAVLLGMFDGVMVVDKNGKILLVNKSLQKYLMIKDDPQGKKPLEIIRNIEIQEIAEKALGSFGEVIAKDVSIMLPEEKVFLVHATSVVQSEKIDGAVLVFHDITELRRLEKIRRDFVANVSHELRTPIASIKGFAETLLEGAIKDKDNADDFLNIIYTESNRLANLINDILELSQIESGAMKLNFKKINLADLVDKVINKLQRQFKVKEIKVENLIAEDVFVGVDEDKIGQVILNLIDNAIKYTLPGGKVTINAEKRNEYLQINISDTGIGIPEKDIDRIFERFYRVDKARSRELGGTGLGLSIVKHIVAAHKGEVYVQSKVNQGSTFSFTVPLSS